MSRAPIQAAGCVVWRVGVTGAAEVALVHRSRYDDWTWPKGKVERGEATPVAAVREVAEETGLTVRLGLPLPTTGYSVGGLPKEVRYWAADAAGGGDAVAAFTPNAEVDQLVWLPLDAAADALSYAHDREVLRALSDLTPWSAPSDLLILLRHARAMKRAHWRGKDDKRPLEDRGVLQADDLVPLLQSYGIDAVHSSDTRRCVDTVEPFAHRLGLPIVPEHHLSERGHRHRRKAAGERVRALLAEGGRRVVCSHRPVLPAALSAAVGASAAADLIGSGLPPAALVVIHHQAGEVLATERHDPV